MSVMYIYNKKENTLVIDTLVCRHKFIAIMYTFFWDIFLQFDIFFKGKF